MRRARLAPALLAIACANSPGGSFDAGGIDAAPDAPQQALDAGTDARPPPDAGTPDAGARPGTCGTCSSSEQCGPGAHCVDLTVGGRACLPTCNPDIPNCPRLFNCVVDVARAGEPVCVPVGGPCCVDEDADAYGEGVGCAGADCDDADPTIFEGAMERCNAVDDDCDGTPDDPPTECAAASCRASASGGFEETVAGRCESGTCVESAAASCGLFACESEARCATRCDVEGADDDRLCTEAAHCDAGACELDRPDGSGCDEPSDCVVGRCDNGFCCASGPCCAASTDCPGGGTPGPICEDPSRCQGSRGEVACEAFTCVVRGGRPDDSACSASVRALDCGLYPPQFCTGESDQPVPRCASSCSADTDCVRGAHCTAGVCEADRTAGDPCTRIAECASGLACIDGVCCTSICAERCMSCAIAGFEGTCSPVGPARDPAGECAGFSCAAYHAGFDATGRCMGRRDVDDSTATCDGAGACADAAVLCPMQPAGVVRSACDPNCESPRAGTCTGTVAGECDPLDDPADVVSCGAGTCARTVQRCVGGRPQTCMPGAPRSETCDGTDDDCDGRIDEDPLASLCRPPAFASSAACIGGACAVTGCDALRADCNGSFDDGCETSLETTSNCGACATPCPTRARSRPTCSGGTCAFVCDAGTIDCDADPTNGCELTTDPCDGPDTDLCAEGTMSCSGGMPACGDTTGDTLDVCNGSDDDCNPATADGADDARVGVGCDGGDTDLCEEGTTSCTGGAVVCGDVSGNDVELCNGIDDDCNPATADASGDPAVGVPCDGPDGDSCAEGVTSCSMGTIECSDTTSTTTELCNGIDDDCDSSTADGSADPAVGSVCDGTDGDLCPEGTIRCAGGALVCDDATGTTFDLCNGMDDDCDPGSADGSEDPAAGVACDGPDADSCPEGITVCTGGAIACSDATPDDVELCNGMDDDCDGATDEDFDLASDPFNCGVCGNACAALCCGGSCTATSSSNCGACGRSCVAGMLVVTELQIDPAAVADGLGEWFEIYNPNGWDIDLRGFVVRDLGSDTHTITSGSPVIVRAMQRAVLGINADESSNGGVALLYQYSSFALGNSGDEVEIDAFGTVLDTVIWPGTFDVNGRSRELSRNHSSATANDTLANWCTATRIYGAGDRGTPGAINDCSL